ncbi:MAG: hypothetical protein NTZ55_03715 [Candidatus Roizmanbacteria bacterium]|nr:hypothetical protein [Candidatus Roizmanbacteria bacterium]
MDDITKRFTQMRTELYADSQLTLQRLIELQKETKDAFNKKLTQLLESNGYLKKIAVPKKYIKLWEHHNKRIQIPINWRYLLSAPFIYGMFFPSVIFHKSNEIYQQVCFRLYGIPLVNYREYFINDRQLLSWLNPWEKINCIYCSYVNNLIRYSAEIGGRTERYWCPIKYYRRVEKQHSQYAKFIDGEKANPEKMRKQWEELRDFSDLT